MDSGLGSGWEKWPFRETGGEAPTGMVSSLDSSVCSAGPHLDAALALDGQVWTHKVLL